MCYPGRYNNYERKWQIFRYPTPNIQDLVLEVMQLFPLRYGWLEKFAINRLTTTDKVSINIDAKNMIKEFGLGSNMADSLSFWLKQCSY